MKGYSQFFYVNHGKMPYRWRGAMANKMRIFLRDFMNEARKAKVVTGKDAYEHLRREMFMIKWYGEDNEKRGHVVSTCTNLYITVAKKRSPQEAQQLIEDVMECGACSEETLFGVVDNEEIVKHSDPKDIWKLLFQSRWPEKKTDEHVTLMVRMLDDLLYLELLDVGEFVSTIASGLMAMPAPQRELVFLAARKGGDSGVIKAMRPIELAQYLPLTTLEKVFVIFAKKYGLVGGSVASDADSTEAEDLAPPLEPPPVTPEPPRIEEGPPCPDEIAKDDDGLGNVDLEEIEVGLDGAVSNPEDPAPEVVVADVSEQYIISSEVAAQGGASSGPPPAPKKKGKGGK